MSASETSLPAPATRESAVAGHGEQSQYLTFLLGEEMFAIGTLSIREIIEYGSLTEVPMTPPFIRGVINLRGAVVPVVDLAVRFGREPRENTKRTCIVIVEVEAPDGTQDMGIVVDAVSEVLEIPHADIEPPPEFGARVRSDFIRGMGKINGKFVILLDADRVLSVEEVAIAASVGRSPGEAAARA
ncbi:MAG TPA: chemotaxis protein CheW [Rhodocyclaceae bacterium]